MDLKPIVESVIREMLASVREEAAHPPKVLYVFGDGTASEAYSDHFIALQNQGIAYDHLFLDGEASAWLGKHRIECGGPGKVIALDEYAPAPIEVPLEYDGIVVPEIDLDSMARASLGIRGTVLSDLIFSALVTEKFVLIGEDVSGLKRADRRTLKTLKLPKPYQNLFRYYKQELAMYGAEFGPREKLAQLAADRCGRKRAPEPGDEQEAAPAAEAEARFDGMLLSADSVKRLLQDKPVTRLTVGPGTLLTPLAQDMLKASGIIVRHADER